MDKLLALQGKLYPTRKQKQKLNQTFGCVRFVHNYYVYNFLNPNFVETEEVIVKNDKEYKKRIYEKQLTLGQLKKHKDKLFLKEVDSLALCNTKLNYEKALRAFLNEKKHTLKDGIIKKLNNNPDYKVSLPKDFKGCPRFKSKKDIQSYTTNNQGHTINYQSRGKRKGYIKLPKIGYIKVNLNREFDGTIKHVTIILSKSGIYKISILVSQYGLSKQKHFKNRQIGLDLGIKSFIKDSNGNVIENPKHLRKAEKRLKKQQRNLSRKYCTSQERSNNYEKQRIVVAKLHEKIANQRKDFQHKLSTKYICENQTICIEDLNVKGMMKNHKLARSIQECGWSAFITMLKYKAAWNNRRILKVNRFYPSSKTCNVCGYKNTELTLKDRFWVCPNCKTHLDRDENAAINILKEALNTAGTAEIQACVTTSQ